MKTGLIAVLTILSLALSSCFKKDETIPLHSRGDVKTDTIALTQNYKFQVYYNLGMQSKVSTNLKTDSDLGFECSSDGWHVILNTGDFMKVADLGVVRFGQAQDTAQHSWKFDKSDGNADSIAIGKWFVTVSDDTVSNKHVYAIDCGMDEEGNPLGIYQVIFDSLKRSTYYFRYAEINGMNPVSASVTKDPSVHYLFYSIRKGGRAMPLEPPANAYDLLFTQYTTLLFTDEGEAYPYLVTGVLSNRGLVEIALDTLDSFENISINNVPSIKFSKAMDVIGYDWKAYNFDAGTYTVRPNYNYVIHARDGLFYKLRFIGFVDANGNKGYPVIEYQGL